MAKRLSSADKEFIAQNCGKYTDEELANQIGCSIRTIERIRDAMGIKKPGGKIIKKRKTAEQELDNHIIDVYSMSKQELYEFHEKELEASARGRRIKNKVDEDFWDLFKEHWIKFKLQFEDTSATDEETLEKLVFLIIRISENEIDEMQSRKAIKALLNRAGVKNIEDLDIDDEDHLNIIQLIKMEQSSLKDANTQYKDLLDRYHKLLESLNSTRRQREERGKIGAKTFLDMIRDLQQRSHRQKEGRLADVIRIATTQNSDKLREGIKFMDGEIAPQLLDTETIKRMKEND